MIKNNGVVEAYQASLGNLCQFLRLTMINSEVVRANEDMAADWASGRCHRVR